MDVSLRHDAPDVERLEAEVRRLVHERQQLREADASLPELEQNRAQIVQAQLALARALIRRHLPPALR